MRLLSRLLARQSAPAASGSTDDTAAEPPAALDDDLRDLLRRRVNSPIKLDLVVYLHDNPYALDDAQSLAARLGREFPLVEACAAELARDGVVEQLPGGHGEVFRLTWGTAAAASVARLVLFCRRGGAPEVRAALRDISVTDAVRSALVGSRRVSALDIAVHCSGTKVRLAGRVNTAGELAEIDALCERLSQSRYGIGAIENRVEVRRQAGPDDEPIQARARAVLAGCPHQAAPESAREAGAGALYVEVEVIGGIAYLTGLVLAPQDRQQASQVVQEVAGVVDVVNWVDVQAYRAR